MCSCRHGTTQRLASYAESVAHFPTAVKEVCCAGLLDRLAHVLAHELYQNVSN